MRQSVREQLDFLSTQRSGVFTAQDAASAGISTRTFYRLRDAGEIVCLSRGVYQLANAMGGKFTSPDYAAIKARVPAGIICLISALYHHDLTTEIPRKINLAISRNASIPRIDHPPVQIYRMSAGAFSSGVQQMEIGGVIMNIFSPEKTIADCFKHRDKLGLDLAIEGVRNYLSRPMAKPTVVMEMAKVCRVSKIIKPYLEALL